MNLEDIKKQAKIAEEWLKNNPTNEGDASAIHALIAAVRLLEQVEVVTEGEEPMVDDVLQIEWKGTSSKEFMVFHPRNIEDNFLQKATNWYKIIQRNNKPCITLPKEIAE